MAFNSMTFLVFFPVVLFVYFVIPKKARYLWLLVSSYFFYACWNPVYLSLILLSTVITFFAGLLVNRFRGNIFLMRISLVACLAINLGLLIYFKYTNFLIHIVNSILLKMGVYSFVPSLDIMLPVGISFYTFQAIGYVIDVYRGDVPVEKNIFRYALFVSFFPQLVAGPIERSKALLSQISGTVSKSQWDYNRVTSGLITMLWGFFMKVVIADRVAIVVDFVFSRYNYLGLIELATAAVLFAVQIYCDFSGYSYIAIGAARVLGFDLMENFNAPYLARNVADFWHRWHISLSTWFRDYIYIPLGGNRNGKFRQYVNLMITFCVSGLWHGANWTYVVWGAIHGVAQVIEKELRFITNGLYKKYSIRTDSFGYRLWATVRTFIVVDFAWIFFRADSIRDAIGYIVRMISFRNWQALFDGELYKIGLDVQEWHILMVAIVILIIVDALKYKTGLNIEKLLAKQWLPARWFALIFLISYIAIFGCYGPGFDSANFIYFQF